MRRYAAFRFLRRHNDLFIRPKYRSHPVIVILLTMTISSVGGWAQALGDKTAPAENPGTERPPIQVNGVFPNLTVMAKGTSTSQHLNLWV